MMDLRGKRILVAEDEAMIRLVLVEEFESAGSAVSEASNGAAALDLLRGEAAFDLLVTDIRMPHLDGWTLAEQARALRPDLPVLYVTGWSDVEPRPVAGGEVLGKPFRTAELVPAAARLLQAQHP